MAEPPTPQWQGVLDRDEFKPGYLEGIDAQADAAKRGDWPAVLARPGLINSWRTGGKSWFTPLHTRRRGMAPLWRSSTG